MVDNSYNFMFSSMPDFHHFIVLVVLVRVLSK